RGDPNDHVVPSVYDHFLADDFGIASKSLLPAFVAHHCHRMSARSLIIIRCKRPSERSPDTKNVKVISGYLVAPYPLVDSIVTHAQRRKPVSNQAGEHIVSI